MWPEKISICSLGCFMGRYWIEKALILFIIRYGIEKALILFNNIRALQEVFSSQQ